MSSFRDVGLLVQFFYFLEQPIQLNDTEQIDFFLDFLFLSKHQV